MRLLIPHDPGRSRGGKQPPVLLLAGAIAVFVFCSCVAFAQREPQPIEKVKAAFVFKFMRYVEWPEPPLDADAPLRIGVAGDDKVAQALSEITKDQQLDGHAIEVVKCISAADFESCQMVFIGSHADNPIIEYVKSMEEKHILTISDTSEFAENGGVIELVERDQRIAIEINVSAAERSRLKISSKLLDLATIVRDRVS